MAVQKVDKIWLDGEFVNWDDANIHILTHTLHYGLGVFEGIRAYKLHNGKTGFFRLTEHMQRLHDSGKMVMLDIPYSVPELCEVSKELYKINKLEEGYLRPIAFIGDGAMGLHAIDNPVRVALIAWPWGAYLGDEGVKKGIRCKISSFNRLAINVNFSKAKLCGNYVNSIMSKREAQIAGYDEGILLDQDGYIAEGSGENFFMVKNGTVITPPNSQSILNGITRQTVMQILKDEGIPILEDRIVREEAYIADEIFLTGTAAEITPVRELDNRMIGVGKPGPVTQRVQELYFDLIRGKVDRYRSWLDIV